MNDQVDQIIRQKSGSSSTIQISRTVNEHLEKEYKKDLRKLLEMENISVQVSKEEKCKVANINSVTTTPSEDSDTERKYLELIDLLTVKMFEDQPENPPVTRASKKSNSLPRTFDIQQSSSSPGPGLTAYERLFGRPRAGERRR